jgi:hypothetical protein
MEVLAETRHHIAEINQILLGGALAMATCAALNWAPAKAAARVAGFLTS